MSTDTRLTSRVAPPPRTSAKNDANSCTPARICIISRRLSFRLLVGLAAASVLVAGCSSGTDSEPGPGGFGFDRSDPEAGVANIKEAFATDEATAACIHDAWGDVANLPPAELTPELMTFEICDTSIFELMTGDARFTNADDG